jgi:hypothetical protein
MQWRALPYLYQWRARVLSEYIFFMDVHTLVTTTNELMFE